MVKAKSPGIYFDMPEDEYHLDAALGSTNLRKLAQNPSDYWFESPLNPHRPPEKSTPARIRGRAMHKLVLEGQSAFNALYCRGPDHHEGMSSGEKAAATREANKTAAMTGHIVLPAEDYDRICIASAMITKNPSLGGVFTGGVSEVSVFWQHKTGVMLKARFDYLKPRGVGDLKSINNFMGLPFDQACRRDIATYRYDVQGAHYLEARRQWKRLADDGAIFGKHDPQFVRSVSASHRFAFQWIFFAAEKAPITWSQVLSPENPMAEIGRETVEKGIDNYLSYMARFGADDMWLMIEEPRELVIEDMPNWYGR